MGISYSFWLLFHLGELLAFLCPRGRVKAAFAPESSTPSPSGGGTGFHITKVALQKADSTWSIYAKKQPPAGESARGLRTAGKAIATATSFPGDLSPPL